MSAQPQAALRRGSLPPVWPLLGHLPAFYRDRLGFLDSCAQSAEPVVALRIGGPTLLLREPADIRFVLQEQPASFQKSSRLTDARGRRLSFEGVLTSSGERHQRLRRALQPLFTRSALADFVPAIGESVSSVTSQWAGSATRDLSTDLPLIARAIIMRIAFGVEAGAQAEAMLDAFLVRKRYLQYRFDFPFFWAEWLPVPVQIRYRRAMNTIDEYLRLRFQREPASPGHPHLLGRMLSSGLGTGEVRDEVITLAITGYETMGDALMWALWLLAAEPGWQAKLRAEAQAVLSSSAPAAADAGRLRIASMIFSEAMRLYPPTWLFVRQAVREQRLPSGYSVPAGAKIYLCPWVLHRDPRFWANPLGFRPEHFSTAEVAARPGLAYFPMGAGPHLCLGFNLAMLEGALVLSLLVRDFEFSRSGDVDVRPVGRMTLRPSRSMPVEVRRLV